MAPSHLPAFPAQCHLSQLGECRRKASSPNAPLGMHAPCHVAAPHPTVVVCAPTRTAAFRRSSQPRVPFARASQAPPPPPPPPPVDATMEVSLQRMTMRPITNRKTEHSIRRVPVVAPTWWLVRMHAPHAHPINMSPGGAFIALDPLRRTIRALTAVCERDTLWTQSGRTSCGFEIDDYCELYKRTNAGLVRGVWWNRTVRQAAARSGTVERTHTLDLVRDIL